MRPWQIFVLGGVLALYLASRTARVRLGVAVKESLDLPRGVRLNNPGNLEQTNIPWRGKVTPSSDPRFEEFATPEDGIRALVKNLMSYVRRHGWNTPSLIAEHWAPSFENATDEWAEHLAAESGLSDYNVLDTAEEYVSATLAIIENEQGTNLGIPWYNEYKVRQIVYATLAEAPV